MARPTTKDELFETASKSFEKLWQIIHSMPENSLKMKFDFSNDFKRNEAHWRRDKNLREVLKLVENFTNEQLFTKKLFNWTGTTSLGSYCVSAMPSHYDWACKKLRAHTKKFVVN